MALSSNQQYVLHEIKSVNAELFKSFGESRFLESDEEEGAAATKGLYGLRYKEIKKKLNLKELGRNVMTIKVGGFITLLGYANL